MKNGMLISVLASLLGLFGCSKGNTEEYKAADIYKDLRQKVLTIDPVALGLKPTSTSGPVWGVLVETGYPKAVATLVTIADGTVSLYFSNGGGIIGVGEHEGPRKACKEFISFSQRFLDQASPTKTFPLPKQGNTRFYFLTFNGVRTAEFSEKDLGADKLPLSPLFHKAQEVIRQARIVDEKIRAEQRGAPDRR